MTIPSVEELKNIRGKPRSRSSALRAQHASIASLREAAELSLRGKRVLVRVDFNVPIERGAVADDTRIQAALPTIDFLLKRGAKVVLVSHFGRPAAKRESKIMNPRTRTAVLKQSLVLGTASSVRGRHELRVVVGRLSGLLNKKVVGVEKWNFAEIDKLVKKLKTGQVLMLPNLRLHPGEEKNNPTFARELASLAQIYVNEAFSVCHRKHASVAGVPKHLPSYVGLQLMKEVEVLGRVLHNPEKPFIVMMGGGKITDKMAMLKAMVKRANAILVGGALATHFFKAMGYGVGVSRVEAEGVRLAKQLLKNKKIILPKDLVVGSRDGEKAWVVEVPGVASESSRRRSPVVERSFTTGRSLSAATPLCEKPYSILDIGPQTILEYAKHIKRARTLIWNGPMGLYEVKRYSHGTLALGRLFAARSKGKAFGVAGGGETIDALKQTSMAEYVDFVSTGGGAMLEFLGGKKLPGLEALHNTERHGL